MRGFRCGQAGWQITKISLAQSRLRPIWSVDHVPLFSCSGNRFGPEVTRCAGHNASGGSGSLLRQTPYNQCPSARASLSRLPVPPTTPPMSKRYQPFSVNRRRVRDDRVGQPRGSVTFPPRKSFPPLGSQEADRRQPRLPVLRLSLASWPCCFGARVVSQSRFIYSPSPAISWLRRAYAWSSPIEGSNKRRFYAVLHIPPIDSPLQAVRAAIVAEHQAATKR